MVICLFCRFFPCLWGFSPGPSPSTVLFLLGWWKTPKLPVIVWEKGVCVCVCPTMDWSPVRCVFLHSEWQLTENRWKKKSKSGESSCSSGGLGKHTDENAPNPTLIKIASTSLSCKRMLAWISHSSFQKIVKLQKASLALNVYLWHFQDDPFWVSFTAELLCLCVWVCVRVIHDDTCRRRNVAVTQPGLLFLSWPPFVGFSGLAPLPNSSTFTRHPEVPGQPISYYQRCQRQKVAELLLLLSCRTCCYLRSPLVNPGCFINQPWAPSEVLNWVSARDQQLTVAIPPKTSMNIC